MIAEVRHISEVPAAAGDGLGEFQETSSGGAQEVLTARCRRPMEKAVGWTEATE